MYSQSKIHEKILRKENQTYKELRAKIIQALGLQQKSRAEKCQDLLETPNEEVKERKGREGRAW